MHSIIFIKFWVKAKSCSFVLLLFFFFAEMLFSAELIFSAEHYILTIRTTFDMLTWITYVGI